ncbi:NAD(P)/FAD-dependent oxidoreductase [Kordiimonas sp.]|uniref:NAD(P)/FAD-dependent oxidoreductase n=1 Tax=Kordiimonas sp. TaxID=1970157 RepID=UPI003A925DFE
MQQIEHTGSYYAATANSAPARPKLTGDIETDVCIVGAGFTGIVTGLTLAELGYKVVILESAKVGWGASGRNGGQIINGFSREIDYIEKTVGREGALALASLALEGGNVIRENAKKYDIECDLKHGSVLTAYTERQMKDIAETIELWKPLGRDGIDLLSKADVRKHVGTDEYIGGWLDHNGGHIHPLNLVLGEAAAAEAAGATIYEQTRVTRVNHHLDTPVVHTESGSVTARYVVLAGNAYLGKTVKELYPKILPASTQIIVTEPLSDSMAKDILPTDMCVEDANYVLDYFRLTADKRLLFGGGTVYGGEDVDDVEKALRPNMERLFPATKGVKVEFGWQGNIALTWSRLPHVGRLGKATYFAHGYSGHGVTSSHMMGRLVGAAVHGDASLFDVFAGMPARSFPGGQLLSVPLSTIGCWWYSMRDKLGV